MTISLSIDFSRATASAICRSSSRLAEMPVRLMGVLSLLGSLLLLFGRDAGGAHVGATLHQLVGEDELGLDDPGEGDERGVLLALQVDGDIAVLGAGQLASEALAALGHAVEL